MELNLILPKGDRPPFYQTLVSCGLFGVADDFGETYLSLDERYLANKESTFFVRAGGESMSPEIKPGDILVVDRSRLLSSGNFITCFFNGSAICKQYFKTAEGAVLKSINPNFKDLAISDEDQFELFGVVIAIVRDLI